MLLRPDFRVQLKKENGTGICITVPRRNLLIEQSILLLDLAFTPEHAAIL